MGVEIVRNVVCDRCGSKCSRIIKRKISIDKNQDVELTEMSFTDNVYHYTEMHLKGFDSRFKCAYQKPFILCGNCVYKLGEFLKGGGADNG